MQGRWRQVQGNQVIIMYLKLKEIKVKSGIVAPWFGQPGGVIQYYLEDATIRQLMDNGKLEVVKEVPPGR